MRTLSACLVALAVLSASSHGHAQTVCKARTLGTLGGSGTHATDLNDWAQVVGRSQLPGNTVEHAFLWERGHMHDLGALERGADSGALAINEWGTIVGSSASQPVIWRGRHIAALPVPDGSEVGVATDINNRGQITGNVGFSQCLLWQDSESEPLDLGTLGGAYCYATAINDLGVVVGSSTTADGDLRGFVWHDGVMREAESIADPSGGYSFSELLDINRAGIAAGRILSSGPQKRPLLWTPRRGGRVLPLADTVASAVNDWGAVALVKGLESATLSLAFPWLHDDGPVLPLGSLGGTVGYDDLALNNRFQIAWTALQPAGFRAYFCQLKPATR